MFFQFIAPPTTCECVDFIRLSPSSKYFHFLFSAVSVGAESWDSNTLMFIPLIIKEAYFFPCVPNEFFDQRCCHIVHNNSHSTYFYSEKKEAKTILKKSFGDLSWHLNNLTIQYLTRGSSPCLLLSLYSINTSIANWTTSGREDSEVLFHCLWLS